MGIATAGGAMNRQRALLKHRITVTLFLSTIFFHHSSAFSNPSENGKISGHIFNASHQPLGGVQVRAITFSGPYFYRMTHSASDGSYEIDQLPVGQYYLRVQNKLGYLNLFYENALDKSNAKLIKINKDQQITGIDFYLERGGFISGHIYDSAGKPLTRNCSIGFFDANNFDQHGFIDGNPDGSFMSPALPAGPHIVKASALPDGYMITYFDNVSTQDSAQAIQVTGTDTVKNIDFYLQKGGAISGYVFGENSSQDPVSNAWILVTNWENKEWSSESMTDATGHYCAAGLKPGAYRVFVYSVDPLQYHNEYYQNSPHYEDAQKVFVTDNDTTNNINFSLKPVKRLILSNDFIEFAVSDRYPGTNLSLGITGGLPATPYDDNKPILFGHPSPYTSFSTILIDGEEFLFGSIEGVLLDDPYISRDSKSIQRSWSYQKIEVKQKITLVTSEWSETKYEDTAQLQYVITNNDEVAHDVGVRILFDTMLGSDDDALIRTSNYPYTGYEQDFYAPYIPTWWTAIEGEKRKTIFSVQGTMKNYGATLPDRFTIANWSNIFKTKWNYVTDNKLAVIKDSGVALWWNPISIKPGNVRIVCTYVGLGEMYPDKEPPYTKNHHPSKDSIDVPLNTNIQLDVLDDYMGVDTTSIVMKVNGAVVKPRITGTLQHYTLSYDPSNNFHYNDTVRVILEASDLAIIPNSMKPDSYQFYISKDVTAPMIQNLYPQPNAHNIRPDTCLSFLLKDNQSGVNKESIQISKNGNRIIPQLVGSPQEFSIRYPFQPPYHEMDSISIHIVATDLATPRNKLDSTFYFFTARDSIAPWVKSYYPPDQATEVDRDTAIVIELIDDFAGVDFNSIWLSVDQSPVSVQITGDSSDYLIKYRPVNGFQYNDQLNVRLRAQDLAKSPNHMDEFEFSFHTTTDTTPPTIAPVTPVPGDTNVVPTPLITVAIKDQKAGVDSSSIRMWINDHPMECKIVGNDKYYLVSYQFEIPFDYLEWITVAVFAQDQSDPPNAADTSFYRFRIMREKDLSPPYVELYQPSKGATDVEPDCSISFHVKDDLSGVDSSSIRLKVDGKIVHRNITGNVHDYRVEYNPIHPFAYGQQVLLEVDARDLAKDVPNDMTTDSCKFIIKFDTSPPAVVWIQPGKPNSHIPLDSEFIVEVSDSQTGVDLSSLKFKFEGQVIQPLFVGEPEMYQIQYTPAKGLNYNQKIQFIITGSDLASPPNWIQDSLFVFYTIEDHEPPYITLRIPDRNEVGVSFTPEITIQIRDDIAGVDRDSIRMTVADNTIMPDISGSPEEYKLIYRDPTGFRPGQRIRVTVKAADLSNPPNPMDEDEYYFFIQEVYPDLFIKSFNLSSSKILVHKPIQMDATIGLTTAPIYDPIQLKVWNNENVLLDTIFQSLDVDGRIDLSRSFIFNHKGSYQIKLSIDPDNYIKESNEANNTAIKTIEVSEGELVVRSNPFTPNDDGINDEVTFNFEKLGVDDPLLKLFDVSGHVINTIKDRNGYELIWDGRDHYGNPAQPGVYLYLLKDHDKTIANGYVVLAR